VELKIVEKEENPLLKRTEVRFEADHSGGPTPKRLDVRKQLAGELGVPEDMVVIEKFATMHGRQVASGIARAYDSKERLEELEPKYLLKRGKPKEEKEGEEKKPKEEPPKKEEKPAEKEEGPKEEPKEEAKPEKEEKPAEKKEEPKEKPKPEKEEKPEEKPPEEKEGPKEEVKEKPPEKPKEESESGEKGEEKA
jgi:small subunit ribosomal protein S24e